MFQMKINKIIWYICVFAHPLVYLSLVVPFETLGCCPASNNTLAKVLVYLLEEEFNDKIISIIWLHSLCLLISLLNSSQRHFRRGFIPIPITYNNSSSVSHHVEDRVVVCASTKPTPLGSSIIFCRQLCSPAINTCHSRNCLLLSH